MDTHRLFARLKRRLAPYAPFIPKMMGGVVVVLLLGLTLKSFSVIGRVAKPLTYPLVLVRTIVQKPHSLLLSSGGRTNLLLLGKGGASHEAPDLTDTIMFFSYDYKTGKSLLLSLPRDLWVDSLKAKVNSAYYYGNLKRAGGGLILSRAALEEIIDQPIHYTVVIDFTTFVKVVDLIGGVEIDVPEVLDDYQYPLPGKENAIPEKDRYEHLHFDKGKQTLDGERALKYVRSRYAEGDAGTDYARAARQQQVLSALLKKIASPSFLLHPRNMAELVSFARGAVESDIQFPQILALGKLFLRLDRTQLQSVVLNQVGKPESLLVNPPQGAYQNQWVLIGRDGSWDEVRSYVATLLETQ